MFLFCESFYYSMQSPHYGQVLTEILPYKNRNRDDIINDIRQGKRPSRPTDSSQNRWLWDQIWDTITACWSEPQRRCDLSIVYHVFLTPGPQDPLVEIPPVGCENLIRLSEELSYTLLTLPLDPDEHATLGTVQEHISNVISRDRTPQTILSPVEEEVLREKYHKVLFSHHFVPLFLKSPVVRQRGSYGPPCGLHHFACGLDFIPTFSSLNRKSSQT
jgi:hypothetical protein